MGSSLRKLGVGRIAQVWEWLWTILGREGHRIGKGSRLKVPEVEAGSPDGRGNYQTQ